MVRVVLNHDENIKRLQNQKLEVPSGEGQWGGSMEREIKKHQLSRLKHTTRT